MVRGIDRTTIFRDTEDKGRFLERLGQTVQESQGVIYAWVLMDNHVHLLFRSGQVGISAVMKKLLTWYAQYFNRKHLRKGHLFENRYKSILCDEDNYLFALVRSLGGWSNVLSMRHKDQPEKADERILGSGDFVHQVWKEELGLSAAEIARHLGVATSSITRAVAKAQKQATA